MAELVKFQTFQKFLDFNNEEILGNYFTYYHLIQLVKALNNHEVDLYKAFNVTDNLGRNVICMWTTGDWFIYSHEWTSEMKTLLQDEIEIGKFKNHYFSGAKHLILELFEDGGYSYEMFKDRVIYECTEVEPLQSAKGTVENVDYEDAEEVAKMSMENYTEEYQGKGQKTMDFMRSSVLHGIENCKIFLLRENGEICSLVQVINENDDFAMIGNLYTKPEKRNQGLAYNLLHTVTQGLLDNGLEKCGLISDIMNPASNKVFLKIGYKPIYKWVSVFKAERQIEPT